MSRNFAGGTDQISMGNNLDHVDFTDYSISIWFRVDTFDAAFQTIFSKGDNNWRLGRDSSTNNSNASVGLFPNESKVVPVLSVNDGVYHHACMTWDGSGTDLEYFIDGTTQGSDNTNDSAVGNVFDSLLGNNDDPTGRNFKGDICEFAFYDTLLTDLQIQSLSRGISPILFSPDNLKAYLPIWNFATEPDWSGAGLTGTVSGTTKGVHAPTELLENSL